MLILLMVYISNEGMLLQQWYKDIYVTWNKKKPNEKFKISFPLHRRRQSYTYVRTYVCMYGGIIHIGNLFT